jgi:hypothetical protein
MAMPRAAKPESEPRKGRLEKKGTLGHLSGSGDILVVRFALKKCPFGAETSISGPE